jgi:hypothetical protein
VQGCGRVLSRSAQNDIDPAIADRACERLRWLYSQGFSDVVWIIFAIRRKMTEDFGYKIRRYLTVWEREAEFGYKIRG